MTTEQERLLEEFKENLADWEWSGEFDKIIERGKALLEHGVEMSEVYDNLKSKLTEWTNVVKVAFEIGVPKEDIVKDYKKEIIEAIIEDLDRDDYEKAKTWAEIIVPAGLSAEELYRILDRKFKYESKFSYTKLAVNIGVDAEVVVKDLLDWDDGNSGDYDAVEAAIEINPQKTATILKSYIEDMFDSDYFADIDDLGIAIDYYKYICGQGAVDELYSKYLVNVKDLNTFEAICEWDETACSPQLLVHYAFKFNCTFERLLDLCEKIMTNTIEKETRDCADAIARETIDQYKKGQTLAGAFLLFEIALKEKPELAYDGILAACEKETEKEGEDADKVLDILKKVAGYMPEKTSEIADKIIDADDSEDTISKDDLEWYKAAYKMDNSKQEKIQSIIIQRAATEKDAEKFCKKIFGKDSLPFVSPSNGKSQTSGRKPGTGKKRKKKSKGILGKIKSLTKPLYKLFK